MERTLSRRNVLGSALGAAAAVAAAVPATAMAAGGRQDDDTELFALLAECARRRQSAEARGIGDDECDRRADHLTEIEDLIEAIRPMTLRGVLALLDWHSSLDMDRLQSGCAVIEGLRAILKEGGAA